MLNLYLSDSPLIPAGGLYHYQPTATGFDESMVQTDGQPGPAIQQLPALKLSAATKLLQPGCFFDVKDVLEIVDGDTTSYLALMPVVEQPNAIWSNGLKKLGDHKFALVPQVQQKLPQVSRDRRRDGYEKVHNDAKDRPDLGHMFENAQNFWQALADVSLGLIQHLERSLNAGKPDGLETFHNPLAVFQLNRMVAEGFIEGYAQADFHITTSVNYQVAVDCRDTWKRVLSQAQVGSAVRIDQLQQDEQDSINLLGQNPLGLSPNLVVANLTPGIEPSQELAFWYLHFPHWHKDLRNAVRTLHDQGISIEDHDWELIAHIIIRNFPDRGTGLSLSDHLIGWVLRETDELIGNFTDLDASLIFNIFKAIEQEALLKEVER